MSRLPRHLLLALSAIALLAPAATPAEAAFDAPGTGGDGLIAHGDDYFVDAFGDPMDFSNPEDLVIDTDEAMFVGGTNKSISGGQLHFDTAGAFQFDPVWAGFPTGIPHGREGFRVPIDTARYRRLVIRMNAPAGAPVGLRWFNCRELRASCQGGQAFVAQAGWHTYEITLGDDGTVPGLPVNWSGPIYGLRFVGTVAGHFDIDWIRLAPLGGAVEEITGAPSVDIRPTGKLDYASAAGNPWDFDSLGDTVQLVGLKPGTTVANGWVSGCTLGTATTQFPGLVFSLPTGSIDANRFKTLTFEYSYDGPFSARPVNGGGKFARVFWTDATGRHPTNAIHLYPNERIVSVRLDDASAVFPGIEPGKGVATGKAWGGTVTQFRINPNDTKDSACFRIGRVWLTADEPEGAVLAVSPKPASPVRLPQTAPKAVKTTKKAAKATTKRTAK